MQSIINDWLTSQNVKHQNDHKFKSCWGTRYVGKGQELVKWQKAREMWRTFFRFLYRLTEWTMIPWHDISILHNFTHTYHLSCSRISPPDFLFLSLRPPWFCPLLQHLYLSHARNHRSMASAWVPRVRSRTIRRSHRCRRWWHCHPTEHWQLWNSGLVARRRKKWFVFNFQRETNCTFYKQTCIFNF